MEILEIAAELGKKIKEDPRVAAYNAADDKFDTDPALKKLMAEYHAQREALQAEESKPSPDDAFANAIETRIEALYKQITANPAYAEYTKAKNALDELMQQVNDEISFQITGERACTHDCSSCGGCSEE